MIMMKYNPSFLTDDELVNSFCVRTHEFASIIEMLRECDGNSNPHRLVIGPRGYGKTNLLLRVAAEIRRDPELSASFFPIVFAEESYAVSTAEEFWLEALFRLAEQSPYLEGEDDLRLTFEDLRKIRNDSTLGKRCLGPLLDFSNRRDKRLVLIVENLNMMFRDMAEQDEGWKLRQTLQTEPGIILLASATSRFNEISNPDHAFYDLFAIRTLPPLSTEECAVLWENVSGQRRSPEEMRGLRILTGGNPRLLSIIARFGAGLSFRNLMTDLLKLIDDLTEYFKSHIESLPAQERRVYLALAELWEPATAREIAAQARLDTSQCSAQLNRLVERGAVEIAGGGTRRRLYYLVERLYNIYYLLRRSRTSTPLIEALIRFMNAYYSPPQLKDVGSRMVHEAGKLGPETKTLHWAAFARLIDLPVLASYREELLSIAPEEFTKNFGPSEQPARVEDIGSAGPETSDSPLVHADVATAIVNKGISFIQTHGPAEAIVAFEEVVRRFGDSAVTEVRVQVARALFNKGIALGKLDKCNEKLAAYNDVVHRFGDSKSSSVLQVVAQTLVNKGVALNQLNQPEEAIAVCDEIICRFGDSDAPEILEVVVCALVNKESTFYQLNQPEKAIAVCDEIMRRFGDSDAPEILEVVAQSLFNKGATFDQLNQPEKAIAVCDEIICRFGDSDAPEILEVVAQSLFNKGVTFNQLNQPEKAISTCGEIMRRFGHSDAPEILEVVARTLLNKGAWLNQPEKIIAVCDEITHRFGDSDVPEILEVVAQSLFNKGVTFNQLNQPEKAISTCGEIMRRFGDSDAPKILEVVAQSLVNNARALIQLNSFEETVAICDEVLKRFGPRNIHAFRVQVAHSLVLKGIALGNLDRERQAKTAWEETVRRFGASDNAELHFIVGVAILEIAESARKQGCFEEAIKAVDQLFNRSSEQASSHQCEGHLVRAQANAATGNVSQAEHDIEAALALLPDFEFLISKTLDVLMDFTILLGATHTKNLIQASPSAKQLEPFIVALDKELGNKPRVGREIDEIADDIREDLEKRRKDKGIANTSQNAYSN